MAPARGRREPCAALSRPLQVITELRLRDVTKFYPLSLYVMHTLENK